MGIALSTAWNASRHKKGEAIIQEISDLGFKEVELSFNLTRSLIQGIEREVKKKGLRVISVHNYCPIPEGLKVEDALPDCYSLASCDENERLRAVKYTKISIDTACRLGASAVVLHCGRVEIRDQTRDLIEFFNRKRLLDPQAQLLRRQIQEERYQKAAPHFVNAIRSLEELSAYAGKLKINLGIENRFYFREIPSFGETGILLEHFKKSNVYYWHDTGHAQLWQDLGFIPHEDYLKNYSARLLGMHLHDIQDARDHKAPLKGSLDFSLLKPYVKKDTLLTIEAHHPAGPEELISAKEYLEKLLVK